MKKRLIAVLSALAMVTAVLPSAVTAEDSEPKPVLQYTFDGKDSLADEKGGGKMRILGGAEVIEDGNQGKALYLNGVDGFAQLPDNIMSDSMTITSWVRIDKFTTWGRLFDFGTDSNENFFFAPYSGGTSRAEIKTKSGTDTMDAAQETVRGDWVHYAVTIGNGTMSYYRNGRLISRKPITQNLGEMNNVANYIGKSHYDGDAYLSAVIDDFRVYDIALDREDVCNIMADGEINPEIMLDSYAIEDGQIVTGDKIELPEFQGGISGIPTPDGFMPWYKFVIEWDSDNKDIISVEHTENRCIATVTHPKQTTAVKLSASLIQGDMIHGEKEYTAYVTGTDENPYTINIDASDRSRKISDTMWGLFFEDINSAADGGLYAEMVQNRSFEMEDPLYSWKTKGDVKVNTENPLNENNPTYVTLGAGASITNDGFQSMSLKKGEKYDFSIYYRGTGWANIKIIKENGEYADIELPFTVPIGGRKKDEWQKLTAELTVKEDVKKAFLFVENQYENPVDIDMVSLIPEDTYKGHGLRKDLMEQLEAMHPKFLRFPGGCAVEGQTMDEAWNWKDTIGDVSERKEMINIWNPSETEPYMMTYGLGFYEYFQMCEDLNMEPVPILNCGMACQVRSGSATDEEHLVPMDKLQPYIDDALDLIAFANGTDENNEWTKKRIEMGHPEPFNMKYIGIGNEQYGEIYFERYAEFAKQIHEKYPDINLITTSGTASSGTGNDLAWNWANKNQEYADLMDEHYYENPDWFRTHAYRYDNYRRDTNTKVFLGEYASKGNTWYNALSEAAFMTGLERNADVVKMASYAPMFAKYGNTQWSAANMIWFNNDDYVLTPNYYVQSLFSNNQGDYSLPTDVKMNGIEKDDTLHGGAVLGSWGTHNEFKDIKVDINGGNLYSIKGNEWVFGNGDWSVNGDTVVQSGDETGSTAWLDLTNLNNYTLTLKAKKTAGGEGFQVGVAAADGQNYYRVNIGGWGNTTAKIQHIVNGVSSETGNVAEQSYVGNVNIEDNEWYDVRVEVSDYEIKAYLNDEFICSYVKPQEYGPVYASSVYDEETGEVIVKLVNTMDSAVNVDVNVDNAKITNNVAKTTVMLGDTSLENSLNDKNAIAPANSEITNASNEFTYSAPANSFSIIHLKTAESRPYIKGYADGTFKPNGTITRAEAAAIIARLSGIDENKAYESKFGDVQSDKWYANYINFAAQKGYITGYADGTFKPDNTITRAEMAVIAGKYIGITPGHHPEFSDVKFDFWAGEYIDAMSLKGLIKGYSDGTFKPNNTITRAEAVTIINRAENRTDAAAQNPFTDIDGHWAYNEILKAVQ